MPEGKRRTPVTVKVHYESYSESNVDGFPIYTFYISGRHYLELPLDANVRLPTEKSIPYKEMTKTLETSPDRFFLQNSGISVIATNVTVNKSKKIVELFFKPDTGIVNGGHTQLAMLDAKSSRDITGAKVKLEVLKHSFSTEELATIAASKNTASNVKPYSTAEKRGYFLKLKRLMRPEFEKHIIWYENREVPNDKGVSAADLIALLNLFNVKKFQSSHNPISRDQPNKSATSKAAVFKEWESGQEDFFHVYPLATDIINLQEHILSTFDFKIPRGFTTLSVVKNLQGRSHTTTFTGQRQRFELPKQFLLPLIAAIRAAVKYDEVDGVVGWYEKPEDVFDRCKVDMINDLLRTYKTTYHNEINKASKDSNLWRILYSDVEKSVNKDKEWKLYGVPG